MVTEVDSPEHYQFGQLEAWDIIELAIDGIHDPVTAYHVASALKYLLRAARKGGDTDVAKAKAHLKREVARHVVRIPSPPEYDLASVAFRPGGVRQDAGDRDAPCAPDAAKPTGHSLLASLPGISECIAASLCDGIFGERSTHPMAAEALRDQDETAPGCAPWRLP